VDRLRRWAAVQLVSWRPVDGDALLYLGATLFALVVLSASTIPLYRQWADIAIGPYAGAAVVAAVLSWRGRRWSNRGLPAPRSRTGVAPGYPDHGPRDAAEWRIRRGLLVAVLLGATVLPLALEVEWRASSGSAAHVQPEVVVIEQAAARWAVGRDPYHAYVLDNHVESATPGEPAYESFDPYLPFLIALGLPSTVHAPRAITDARNVFLLVTLGVGGLALALLRGSRDRKLRVLQFLWVLPTAALPLATGGDDLPVVAVLLLGMVLAQRRLPGLAGVTFGIACAMKFTAWPLALLALFAARAKDGRRAPGRMAVGIVAVTVAAVTPFALHNPKVFITNVIAFPLGLSGVVSPAASAMPGHVLVSLFPVLHTVLPVVAVVFGGSVLAWRLVRRPPRGVRDVAMLAGWALTVAILIAPATRVGYLLYPINFFAWALLFQAVEPLGQAASLEAWKTRIVNRVRSSLAPGALTELVPTKVEGETSAPISQ